MVPGPERPGIVRVADELGNGSASIVRILPSLCAIGRGSPKAVLHLISAASAHVLAALVALVTVSVHDPVFAFTVGGERVFLKVSFFALSASLFTVRTNLTITLRNSF